ncbi:XRE family transcriptional regulator [Sinorhizobium meliloti]|uniref:helix-turn-helix domain-containing protein n=1 Tax=Rhizobium meliloti TaxID=382 RepID=UPI000FE0D37B|nr:helix-turn-helix transcriptional regulator [Sinorhizobium meliloti]RVK96168.1 XRE family transcriptional regulator [Sinorhizobium meliloti]
MTYEKSTNDIDLIIGANIHRIRVLAGVSRRGLGNAVGLSFSQIKKCEDGQRRISASSIVAVAKALNCSLDQFWKGVDPAETMVVLPAQSEDAITVSRNFDRIPSPAHREAIAELIATLAAGGALKSAAE